MHSGSSAFSSLAMPDADYADMLYFVLHREVGNHLRSTLCPDVLGISLDQSLVLEIQTPIKTTYLTLLLLPHNG